MYVLCLALKTHRSKTKGKTPEVVPTTLWDQLISRLNKDVGLYLPAAAHATPKAHKRCQWDVRRGPRGKWDAMPRGQSRRSPAEPKGLPRKPGQPLLRTTLASPLLHLLLHTQNTCHNSFANTAYEVKGLLPFIAFLPPRSFSDKWDCLFTSRIKSIQIALG